LDNFLLYESLQTKDQHLRYHDGCIRKTDKQKANRAERHKVKLAMVSSGEIEVLPTKRETSDVWSMAKDGKIYFDASKNPKLMRK
jgi:hypothetical protein